MKTQLSANYTGDSSPAAVPDTGVWENLRVAVLNAVRFQLPADCLAGQSNLVRGVASAVIVDLGISALKEARNQLPSPEAALNVLLNTRISATAAIFKLPDLAGDNGGALNEVSDGLVNMGVEVIRTAASQLSSVAVDVAAKASRLEEFGVAVIKVEHYKHQQTAWLWLVICGMNS